MLIACLAGNAVRSFLPFAVLTTVDGHQDGVPHLPETAPTGLNIISAILVEIKTQA